MILDIATKIIDSDQRIWAVFPGLARRFFNEFQNGNVIFLDTPNIALNPEALEDEERLRQHVAMSLAWRSYLLGKSDEIPARNPANFDPPRDPSFNAAVGNVRSLFVRMKPGDLVLVGQYDVYAPVLIGEIAGPFDPSVTITLERYGDAPVPARRVVWLPVEKERRYLSKELSKLLSNRKAVVNVDEKIFGEEIYKIAYGDYVDSEYSRYIFDGRTYDNHATDTIPGIRLISYFCAAFKAADIDKLTEFFGMDIDVGIDEFFDKDLLASFEIDFSSPGEYVLYAKRTAMAVTVALLVSVTSGTTSLTDARDAEIINSVTGFTDSEQGQAVAAKCPIQIEDKYRAIMSAINADRYNALCGINERAKRGVGLSVRVRKHAGLQP